MKNSFLLVVLAFGSLTMTQEPLMPCPDPPYNNAIAEAIVNGIESFRPYMAEGIPALGIPPLDPLGPLPVIGFSIHNDYIDLVGTVNETIIYKLSEFITCEVTVDLGIRPKFFMELRLNNYHMDGFYDMDGVYVSIFPIFGTGNYVLDVFNASLSGAAGVTYNLISDHAQIHDLLLNITFQELQLFMECILGCGDMADFINQFVSEIAVAIFDAVWAFANPIVNQAVENGINKILKNIYISDLLDPGTTDLPPPPPEIADYAESNRVIKFLAPLRQVLNP